MSPLFFWISFCAGSALYQVGRWLLGFGLDPKAAFEGAYWMGFAMLAVYFGWARA